MAYNLFDHEIAVRTAIGEARGEPDAGMQAVIWTGVNRFTMKRWFSGATLAGTFLMPAQYDCWMVHDPNYNLVCNIYPGIGQFDTVMGWVDSILKGGLIDPTEGATHYANLKTCNPSWVAQATKTVDIGRHTFFKNVS